MVSRAAVVLNAEAEAAHKRAVAVFVQVAVPMQVQADRAAGDNHKAAALAVAVRRQSRVEAVRHPSIALRHSVSLISVDSRESHAHRKPQVLSRSRVLHKPRSDRERESSWGRVRREFSRIAEGLAMFNPARRSGSTRDCPVSSGNPE